MQNPHLDMDRKKNNAIYGRRLLFKKCTRKEFTIFCSLCKIIRIGVLCLVFSPANHTTLLNAQSDTTKNKIKVTEIKEIEITGHRNTAVFSEISRIVAVIHGDDIVKSGIQSLQDILEYASNIDLRQRGLLGVQSDISIRGGSFDHTMVLLNGINLSDPQTGHANLDLPIDIECIDRIEVLEGPAARSLGAGAFTGAINVITKPGNDNRLSINQFFGEHGFMRTNINGALRMQKFRHFLSAGISSSKGYMADTDFGIKNAFYAGNFIQNNAQIDFQAGVQEKKFGAAGFYSPRFPDQYEETGLWFASIRASAGEKVKISPLVYVRHRKDHYLLDRDNPDLYENFHLTNIAGSQINISWLTGHLLNTVGFDLRTENILSNNLGFNNEKPIRVKGEDSAYYTKRYGRDNVAYFQEHKYSKGKFDLSGGFMINWNSAYPDKLSFFPGLDLSYRFLPFNRLYFSINRGLNFPSFTDLFYVDPVNQGNINLKPNRLVSWEAGIKRDETHVNASLTFFRNTGRDIIDWLWSYGQRRFSPVNIQNFLAQGLETGISFHTAGWLQETAPIRVISVNYVFMNIRKSVSDSVSKYDHIRNKLSLMIRHRIIRKIEAVWTVSCQDRMGETVQYSDADNYYFTPNKPYWLLDASITWNPGPLVFYAVLNNVLNTNYIDAGSVTQPGRWFKAGITLNLEKDRKNDPGYH